MKKLRTRLTRRFFTVAMTSVILTAIAMSIGSWFNYTSQIDNTLRNYGQILIQSYNNNQNFNFLDNFNSKDYRFTLIDPNGNVVYESEAQNNASDMDNHINRPEIQDAIKHGAGKSYRYSDTLGTVTYYYAVRAEDGYILRVSIEVKSVINSFVSIIPMITGIVICVLLFSIYMASVSTKKIVTPIEKMTDDINDVAYEELVPFATTIEKQRSQIKKQIAKIQLEKDKINALIANMNEGFLLLDMDKNILIENDSAAFLLGSMNNKIVGENIINLSRNSDFLKCIDNAVKGQSGTVKFKHKGNNIQLLANPILSDGKQKGVICLIMNITEKEKTEKMRREFTANVSHELKTPLTTISGYAEMIENGMAQADDIQRFAGKIHKEAGRMIALIGDIIELSHLDEPRKKIEKQYVKLREITEECFDSLSSSAEKHGVTLSVQGDNVIYYGNRAMLYEVIYNLCDNAIRYNKQNGEVNVGIADKINKAVVTVSDTGIGIPQKHHSRIFERFYRVDKSHSKETGGTGLGLAIVKHIVEQHNGKIEIESSESTGTSIRIILPK